MQQEYEDVFVAEITAVTGAGPYVYSWKEKTIDPLGPGYLDVPGGRFGIPGDGYAYELNDREVPVGTLVRMKVRGIVNGGDLVFDFTDVPPPGGFPARLTGNVGTAYSWQEQGYDGAAWFDAGRSGTLNSKEANDTLNIPLDRRVWMRQFARLDLPVPYRFFYERDLNFDGDTITVSNSTISIDTSVVNVSNTTVDLTNVVINTSNVTYVGTPACYDFVTLVCLEWEEDGAPDLADWVPPCYVLAGPEGGGDGPPAFRLLTAKDVMGCVAPVPGDVLFVGADGFVAEDPDLFFWDVATHSLGIGGHPTYDLDVLKGVNAAVITRTANTTAGGAAMTQFRAQNDAGALAYQGITSTTFTAYNALGPSTGFWLSYLADALYGSQDSRPVIFCVNLTEIARFNTSGQFGVGCAPANPVDVNGACHASSFPVSSDARLKQDVQAITGALARVQQLQGVTFAWSSTYAHIGRQDAPGRKMGLIAQDVEGVVPEVVSKWQAVPEKGRAWGLADVRALDYPRLVPLLIEAIKELAARVAALEAKTP
jgi:hypothetical protein